MGGGVITAVGGKCGQKCCGGVYITLYVRVLWHYERRLIKVNIEGVSLLKLILLRAQLTSSRLLSGKCAVCPPEESGIY